MLRLAESSLWRPARTRVVPGGVYFELTRVQGKGAQPLPQRWRLTEPALPSPHLGWRGWARQRQGAVRVLGEAVSPRPRAEANSKGNTEDSCPRPRPPEPGGPQESGPCTWEVRVPGLGQGEQAPEGGHAACSS